MSHRGERPPGSPEPARGAAAASREFFTVRTVSDALTGFRPARRTAAESVPLDEALGRVPTEPLSAPHALPGFARATVDGFAVRAADTYGASEGLPSYLDMAGEVRMGEPPEVEVRPGTAVAIATGAPLPPGADAVVKVEHTQAATAELLEILRPATPGEGLVRADEDAAPGAALVPAGRPLRAQDLGMLAAAGLTEIPVHARPRVTIVSTGDELVPAGTPELPTGQVRDATAPALAALVREAGGEPTSPGSCPTTARRWQALSAPPYRRVTLPWFRLGPRSGRVTRPRLRSPRLGSPGSGVTGLRCAPVSRRCSPTAAVCP